MFDKLDPATQERLSKIMSTNMYLNAKENHDGSLGEVKVTPKELRDMLADAYLEGYSDH